MSMSRIGARGFFLQDLLFCCVLRREKARGIKNSLMGSDKNPNEISGLAYRKHTRERVWRAVYDSCFPIHVPDEQSVLGSSPHFSVFLHTFEGKFFCRKVETRNQVYHLSVHTPVDLPRAEHISIHKVA